MAIDPLGFRSSFPPASHRLIQGLRRCGVPVDTPPGAGGEVVDGADRRCEGAITPVAADVDRVFPEPDDVGDCLLATEECGRPVAATCA
jgi:hypothetical protein